MALRNIPNANCAPVDLQIKIVLDIVKRDIFFVMKWCYTVMLGVGKEFTAAQEPHILFNSATLIKNVIPAVFATQEKIW